MAIRYVAVFQKWIDINIKCLFVFFVCWFQDLEMDYCHFRLAPILSTTTGDFMGQYN